MLFYDFYLSFALLNIIPYLHLQVLALDKRFLDPRRTLNPTQAEKEEGIIPLTDSLPIIPQVMIVSFTLLLN